MKLSFIIPMYVEEYNELMAEVLLYWSIVSLNHEVIIVDDGSPNKKIAELYDDVVEVIRIEENIPWNQPAARNLGAKHATGDILIFTDFDHIFDTFDFTVIKDNFENNANAKTYMFPRVKNGELIGSHPCSFAILKENFKGFDESFCGHYGYDDTEFLRRHQPTGILPISTKVVLHKSTHNLKRDTKENQKKL